jgi:hypothetical protein
MAELPEEPDLEPEPICGQGSLPGVVDFDRGAPAIMVAPSSFEMCTGSNLLGIGGQCA